MGQPPSAYLSAKKAPWKDTTRSLIRCCWTSQWARTEGKASLSIHDCKKQSLTLPLTH